MVMDSVEILEDVIEDELRRVAIRYIFRDMWTACRRCIIWGF